MNNSEIVKDPHVFFTGKRYDLLAKCIYVRYSDLGLNTEWGKDLYKEHIRVFNGYVESDGSEKYGADDFINGFDSVIDDISKNEFSADKSIIPIGSNNLIIDGAHRLATCLYYDTPLTIEKKQQEAPEYNYEFFIRRGLEQKYTDAMAIEYCRLEPNCFVPIIYPSAQGKDEEVKSILSKYGEIVYCKEINLVKNGPVNLVRQIYCTEPWVGNFENQFSGAKNKAMGCFQSVGAVRAFVVKSDLDRMLKAKNEIRDLFNISNHSVHINDTHEESIQLSNILFNENSIHFLNYSNMVNMKWFQKLLSEYKQFISRNDIDVECLCIDGSAVMAAYGIREARDLDYLHHGYDDVDSGYKEIGSHNFASNLYQKPIDDIVFNPQNFFYYDNLKFVSLNLIKAMKTLRGEEKDHKDVSLIDDCLKGVVTKKTFDDFAMMFKPKYWYTKVRFIALKIRFHLYKVMKKFR